MKVKDVKIGDAIRFAGRNCKVTAIDNEVGHITLTFDLYSEGLFPEVVGWSFWVFYDENEEITPEADAEEDTEEDAE